MDVVSESSGNCGAGNFNVNIYDWIFSIFLEASGTYCDQVSLHFDYDFPRRFIAEPPFPLLDPTITDNGRRRVMLYGSSDTLTSVCQQIVEVLLNKKQNAWQDVELEFLLWCAVSSRNRQVLKICLQQMQEAKLAKLPASLLPCRLLSRALELVFIDGVELLLDFGADPNLPVEPSLKAPLLKIPEIRSSLLVTPSYIDRELTKMTMLLLKYGADPMVRGELGQIVLHDLARFCFNSADCSALIIKATPPEAYKVIKDKSSNVIPPMSPLTSAFFYATWAPSNQRTARLARIFSFSIIPLLRCGATLQPDPFEDGFDENSNSNVPFSFIPDFYSMAPETVMIWNKPPTIFASLVLEARQKNSFDFVKFAKIEAKFRENHRLDQSFTTRLRLQWMQDFGKFIKAEFPRSLQCLCRTAIHRHLPRGFDRPAAIKSLELPVMLEDFLSYRQFDVLPESLSIDVADSS